MKNKSKWYPLLLLGFVLLLASSLIACEPSTPPPPPSSPALATIAASPSMVIGFRAEQGRLDPSSQALEIRNSGAGTLDWSVTDDAGWLTLSPTSGSCSSEEINEVTVSVNIAGISEGDYPATITISAPEASNSPQQLLVNLTITPVTTTVTPIIPTVTYDVSVAVSPGSQSGLPGDTLGYTVTITNKGTEADTYDLSITDDHGWTLTAPSATSAIASVRSEVITLSLTIPPDAVPETEDEITIIATSQNDPTTIYSATCTAVVIEEEEEEEPPPTTPASVSIIPSSTTISPGDTFTIEVVIDSAISNVKACEVVVTFDADLTATDVIEYDLLGTAAETLRLAPTIPDGKVSYAVTRMPGNDPAAVSGAFISITFEISQTASPSSYSLNVEAKLVDESLDEITGIVDNDGVVIVQ